MKALLRVSSCVGLAALSIACSSASTGGADGGPLPNEGNGVDDVKQACLVETAWTQSASPSCKTCVFEGAIPSCTCDMDPDHSRCYSQALAKADESDCSLTVDDCVNACMSDCTCVDGCFANHAACRAAASALKGCLAALCDPVCR